jgi:hypothetical protein
MHAGDLVTLPWWTQLWLNEGFATYFENIGASGFWASGTNPPGPLSYMHAFGVDILESALRFDAGNPSYSLAQAARVVTSELQAESLFGRVVYEKGGSVLRMLHALVVGVGVAQGVSEPPPWQVRRLLEDDSGDTEPGISLHTIIHSLHTIADKDGGVVGKFDSLWGGDGQHGGRFHGHALTLFLQSRPRCVDARGVVRRRTRRLFDEGEEEGDEGESDEGEGEGKNEGGGDEKGDGRKIPQGSFGKNRSGSVGVERAAAGELLIPHTFCFIPSVCCMPCTPAIVSGCLLVKIAP